jgi:Fe-S-cluster containining protein
MSTQRPLDELRALYTEVDTLLSGWACDASTDCCRFGVTGREPYPTAIEQAEVERAVRARGGLPKRRSLPTVRGGRGLDESRTCALLSDEGKCVVYTSRPFGCRTFFCERAHGPAGEAPRHLPKAAISSIARAIADLSERFAPADPGPRPMSKFTSAWASRPTSQQRRR